MSKKLYQGNDSYNFATNIGYSRYIVPASGGTEKRQGLQECNIGRIWVKQINSLLLPLKSSKKYVQTFSGHQALKG